MTADITPLDDLWDWLMSLPIEGQMNRAYIDTHKGRAEPVTFAARGDSPKDIARAIRSAVESRLHLLGPKDGLVWRKRLSVKKQTAAVAVRPEGWHDFWVGMGGVRWGDTDAILPVTVGLFRYPMPVYLASMRAAIGWKQEPTPTSIPAVGGNYGGLVPLRRDRDALKREGEPVLRTDGLLEAPDFGDPDLPGMPNQAGALWDRNEMIVGRTGIRSWKVAVEVATTLAQRGAWEELVTPWALPAYVPMLVGKE